AEKVEVPPGAAELAVGRKLKAKLLLLLDDVLDLAILDRLELGRRDGALFALGARFLERSGSQEAADMIGTKWRFGPLHRSAPWGDLARAKARQQRRRQPQNDGQIVPWCRGTHPIMLGGRRGQAQLLPLRRGGGGGGAGGVFLHP